MATRNPNSRPRSRERGLGKATAATWQRMRGYISGYQKDHGRSPSISEIQTHMGYAHHSTVMHHLRRMEVDGLLRMTTNPSRISLDIMR